MSRTFGLIGLVVLLLSVCWLTAPSNQENTEYWAAWHDLQKADLEVFSEMEKRKLVPSEIASRIRREHDFLKSENDRPYVQRSVEETRQQIDKINSSKGIATRLMRQCAEDYGASLGATSDVWERRLAAKKRLDQIEYVTEGRLRPAIHSISLVLAGLCSLAAVVCVLRIGQVAKPK